MDMNIINNGVYYYKDKFVESGQHEKEEMKKFFGISIDQNKAQKNTISYQILAAHNQSNNMEDLEIKFDSLTSHDITYVGIIQTAKASGLDKFPIPYILTCCHNSLCAVGGTINEDDHIFGLTAAQKYGGIYVPPNFAVIHQYMREMIAGCGQMILGSDSHTRYGALGTMAIGEGGGELAKQLLNRTYDLKYPEIIAVHITGKPQLGVGPQDIALTIIKKVFSNGFVKNKVMEFIGSGIKNLSVEYRNGIDVMTTETTCLSSIWETDDLVEEYLSIHGRKAAYKELRPKEIAYYDGVISVDLSEIKPSIALPFHPSNVYTIEEFNENMKDILHKTAIECANQLDAKNIDVTFERNIRNGKFHIDQAIIAGCAGGTYDNICDVADILLSKEMEDSTVNFSIYPSSIPTYLNLVENGVAAKLLKNGVVLKQAFCGPCFGAGDTPANNEFSIRHTTRNFPNREGSKLREGQISYVALMDARSIAATMVNGGLLTSATTMEVNYAKPKYYFDKTAYDKKIIDCYEEGDKEKPLILGPNIKDWPEMQPLSEHILLKVASIIKDDVTTTDELIPSGETSSYRSNPIKLSDFALSRKDPEYVPRAKKIQNLEKIRLKNKNIQSVEELKEIYEKIRSLDEFDDIDPNNINIASVIYAVKPGDGSAREQAASAQRVLGGLANITKEYATKRYRSNLINWGMIPFTSDFNKENIPFEVDDYIFVPNIKSKMNSANKTIKAYIVNNEIREITLNMPILTESEREIIIDGSLINYYRKNN